MNYAKSIPESAPVNVLQNRAAQYAEFARRWQELASNDHQLDLARTYQQLASYWYTLARVAA